MKLAQALQVSVGILIGLSVMLGIFAIIGSSKKQIKEEAAERKAVQEEYAKDRPCQWCRHCMRHHLFVDDPIDHVTGYVCVLPECEAGKARTPCLDYWPSKLKDAPCKHCGGKLK